MELQPTADGKKNEILIWTKFYETWICIDYASTLQNSEMIFKDLATRYFSLKQATDCFNFSNVSKI